MVPDLRVYLSAAEDRHMAGPITALWSSVQNDPVVMRKINGWATIVWFIAAFPICIWLSESVPFLVFVSVYAVVTGHWSTYVAARVEVKQTEAEENTQ
jgi:hypothetical protein